MCAKSTDDELTEHNEHIKSAIASKCDCPDKTGDKNHCHEIRSSDVSNAIVKMKSDKISDNGLEYFNNFIFGTNLLYRCLSILFTSMNIYEYLVMNMYVYVCLCRAVGFVQLCFAYPYIDKCRSCLLD